MYWKDEGYLLSKHNFDENSLIIEAFTLEHGKYSGIVYGGSSRKQKGKFQIGNKFLLNWKSKTENKVSHEEVNDAFWKTLSLVYIGPSGNSTSSQPKANYFFLSVELAES